MKTPLRFACSILFSLVPVMAEEAEYTIGPDYADAPETQVKPGVPQDGLGYRRVLPKILDNMIEEKRLPVMVAVMINSGGRRFPRQSAGS